MLGQVGLFDLELVRKLSKRKFFFPEKVNDSEPLLVGERGTNFGMCLKNRFFPVIISLFHSFLFHELYIMKHEMSRKISSGVAHLTRLI